eukprot:766234-Pelagomonas_calceolata.AAC.1
MAEGGGEQQQVEGVSETVEEEEQEEGMSRQGSTDCSGMDLDEEEEEVGGVEEGGMSGNEAEGGVHAAVPGRRCERVKKPQLSYQMHRD